MDQLAGLQIVERCAHRHSQRNGVAVEAGAVGTHAVLAALRLVLRVVAEVDEGVMALRADHDHVAASAAVAARGSAAGHELLPAEGHATVAAVAGLDANLSLIDEHGESVFNFQVSVAGSTGVRNWAQKCVGRLFSLPNRD